MTNSLMHYGVKKQKWGVRRYQYEDKSLTPEGRIHYGVGEPRKLSRTEKKAEKNLRRSRAEREYLQRQRQDIFDSMDRDKKDFTFEGWEDTVKERDYWKKLYDEETDPEVKKWWKDEIRELDDQLYEYEENAAFMKAKQKDYTESLDEISLRDSQIKERDAKQAQKFMKKLGEERYMDIYNRVYEGFKE